MSENNNNNQLPPSLGPDLEVGPSTLPPGRNDYDNENENENENANANANVNANENENEDENDNVEGTEIEEIPTEVSPLLVSTSHISNNDRRHYDDDESDRQSVLMKMAKRPFWWFAVLGVLAFIVFELSFLPRTSLSRDYRRWNGLKLTKSDVKRHFLLFSGIGKSHNSLTTEEYINNWLTNFTAINEKQSTNLISAENIELVSFVQKHFKNFGFKVQTLNYELPSTYERSVDSSLKLLDNKGNLIYEANLQESKSFTTPSYYIWGINGSVQADYVFVNEGTLADYNLVRSHGIEIKNKIVITKTNWLNKNLTINEKIQIAERFEAAGFINYYDFKSIINNNKEIELKELNSVISRGNSGNFVDISPNQIIFNWVKPQIPAIPISFKSIKPILDTFQNDKKSAGIFNDWDYYPSRLDNSIKLQLLTNFESSLKSSPRKLTNIIASIKGVLNDGDIVIGARRDSTTSSNPLSNHAILLEIMRNYQRLVNMGWKPLRNIKFVSWDGSNSGSLGTHLFTNDTDHFNTKRSILAYINIDGDAVTGSKFHIDSNPFFNHILKKTSKYIPIPKSSTPFKTLTDEIYYDKSIEDDEDDTDEEGDDNDDNDLYDDDGESYTTLHRYWSKQDNNSINDILGRNLIDSDSLIFQNHLSTPIINLRFENDVKRDSSLYVPNSNYYSYEWLIKRQIDEDLLLHGSLIRYIGLLAITLSEHEVVDYRTRYYSHTINNSFENFLNENREILNSWANKNVSTYLINKSNIFKDFKNEFDKDIEVLTLSNLISQFQSHLTDLFEISLDFDKRNKLVQDGLTRDYPWYKFYKKVQHFAEFKLSNYILLHLEKNRQLNNNDYQYLNLSNQYYFNHALYGIPKFNVNSTTDILNNRFKLSTFTHLHEAVLDDDFENTVKWLVIIYDKLKF
ncbi:vacuolar targeting protein [Scheffersomyces amazonensis]|uniref:vacuolar targeting protein n=1 Tax=Scheffersomyces amazonensis TaxID=1078765 RepID=UPI00315D7AB2